MSRHRSISDQTFHQFCRGVLALLAACCLAGCNWSSTTLALENTSNPSSASSSSPESSSPESSGNLAAPVEVPSKRLRAKLANVDRNQLVGTWRDKFLGTRTLTLNEDGTARMVLDLDFAGRLLYGNQLDFEMTWMVEDATITIEIVDGKPAKSAKSAMDTWGSRYEYLLDCVEDQRIEMRDWDGSANYKLRRIPNELTADPKK